MQRKLSSPMEPQIPNSTQPASLKWTPCSSMPVNMRTPHAVWLRNKLYVGGGKTELGYAADANLYEYDAIADEWKTLRSPVSWFALTTYHHELVLIGGVIAVTDDTPRYFRSRAYAFSGYTMEQQVIQSRSHDNFKLSNGIKALIDGSRFEDATVSMNMHRHSACAVSQGNFLVVVGGIGLEGKLKSMEVYNGSCWSLTQLKIPLSRITKCVLIDEKLYIACGSRSRHMEALYTTLLSKGEFSWKTLDLPSNVSTIISCNMYLVAIGNNLDILVYSHKSQTWISSGVTCSQGLNLYVAAIGQSGILMVISKSRAHRIALKSDDIEQCLSSKLSLANVEELSDVLEDTIDDERHIAAVQQAMERKGVLNHTIIHGVFVGQARSGKNSLMERLLGRWPKSSSPSTGVADSTIQVKVTEKSTTVSTNVEGCVWSAMDLDDEAIKWLLVILTQNYETPTEQESDSDTEVAEEWSDNVNTNSGAQQNNRYSIISAFQSVKENFLSLFERKQLSVARNTSNSSPGQSLNQRQATSVQHMPNTRVEAVTLELIFKQALKNKNRDALQQTFAKFWSLNLTNTGGQIEFQEVLPLLVSGPSIFFFVFRLDRDLTQRYIVEYELSDGTKATPYKSTLTTIDSIYQTLASISTMGTFVYHGLQKRKVPLRPKVFFIGTHRDNLGDETASTIAKIDQQLRNIIKSTSHYDELVEFASDSQLMFAVNNFSRDDEHFKAIRSALERVVKRDQFHVTSPAHWLVFSLIIRKNKANVISFDECLEIAKTVGITSKTELKDALHFIQTKMGLIRYYEDVDNIVVLRPQFLFDKVTELIVGTFTFTKAGKQVTEEFKCKGIFSIEELEKVTDIENCSITPVQFGKLLEKVRIAAPFRKDNKVHYFFPCVLAHAAERSDKIAETCIDIPPLLISFKCGFCPKGLPGGLIMYLTGNEMITFSSVLWKLQTDKIYRDEVSFHVGPYDTVILRVASTHLEVTCIRDPLFEDCSDIPIQCICRSIWTTLVVGIKQVTREINYLKTQHSLTFACQAVGCPGKHPAEISFYNDRPRSLLCKNVGHSKFPDGYEFWDLRESTDIGQPAPTTTRLTEQHHSSLMKQLTIHAAFWRHIGEYLRFQPGELDNIEANPSLHFNAPVSYLSKMLALWLQWAPNDERGSSDFASLEALKRALLDAGLGATACDVGISPCSE